METLDIIFATVAGLALIEGLCIALMPKQVGKILKDVFKNKKKAVKIGLIEIILALFILFLISL